ncbi:MAG: hypothetical protein RLZZ214_1983, partial [Verrucomicrobiota bacterium]
MRTTTDFLKLLCLSLFTLFGVSSGDAQVPVRIMPLGDSITGGFTPPSTVSGGYRKKLYTLLTAPEENYAVDFTGTLNYPDAVSEGWADGDHEGHGGFKIADLRNRVSLWLKQTADPDVILLHIGTNDFWNGENVATTQDRLRDLLADLSTLRPHARIIVSSLIPRTDSIEAIQVEFNQSLPGIVAAQAALGRKVTFVDMHAALAGTPDVIGPDGVHPTPAGLDKMAYAWLPAIKSVITPSGTIAPPAITSVSARVDLQHVTVSFSKPINDADGSNAANFQLSGGVSVSNASLDASKRVVTLTTSTQLADEVYTLSVSGVRDRMVPENPIAVGTAATFTSRTFVDGSFEQNDTAWQKLGNVAVLDSQLQRASDGQKLVVFSAADQPNDGRISQSIPTTANQRYRLQFDIGVYSSNSDSQSLQLTIRDGLDGSSGQVLLSPPTQSVSGINTTGVPLTVWQIRSFEFTAISSNTTITFEDASSETASIDLLLDDVRIDVVNNQLPVAVNDGGIGIPFLTVAAGSSASSPISVLANDSDADADPLTVIAAASPNGTVTINGGQSLSFTPAPGFTGEATISYTISDGNGGSSGATVWISVVAVGPFANGSFENGTPVDFGVPEYWDTFGSAIGYSNKGFYVPQAGNGIWMVVFNAGNNVPVSRLSHSFSTVVGQTYTVAFDAGLAGGMGNKSQTLRAEVSGEAIPPGSARNWQITSTEEIATWSEKTFTFTAGSASSTLIFTVDISDEAPEGQNVDLVLDDVRVTPIGGTNQVPVSVADSYSTVVGAALAIAAPGVLANDTDDAGPLTAQLVTAPNQGGGLVLNPNGGFTYTPANG